MFTYKNDTYYFYTTGIDFTLWSPSFYSFYVSLVISFYGIIGGGGGDFFIIGGGGFLPGIRLGGFGIPCVTGTYYFLVYSWTNFFFYLISLIVYWTVRGTIYFCITYFIYCLGIWF